MAFYPAEDIRERRRAVSSKDFALSSLHVSSLLLSTAAEHFPAEHEAMRLMSPICDSLSHPLPGGQCCLCLHGLKVLGEGWRLGSQVLYPAPLLSAWRAEDPSKHPALGVMPMERAVVLGLVGMPSSWNRRDWDEQSAVFPPSFAGSGSGPILRPFNICFLAFPSLLGKIRSATQRVCLARLWSFSELLKNRGGPCISWKKANSGNDLSFFQVKFCVVGWWVFPPVVNEPLFSTGCRAIGILTMVVASWQPKS